MFCHESPDSESYQPSPITRSAISKNWEKFTKWRDVTVISNLCRLINADGDTITIKTDVSYKDVVGLRWPRPKQPKKLQFQVVTAMGIVYTSDGFLVMIPRDSGDWPPSIECPGGFIRAEYLEDGKINVQDFIRTRVAEDLDIDRSLITDCDYLHVYDAKEIMEYMLLYKVKIAMSKAEIKSHNPDFVLLPRHYRPEAHCTNCISLIHAPTRGALLTL
tara:strand:- start:4715 stop:5368 length:654 start_codon:yes stop_codon:yes gene_type:complete